MLSRVVLIGVLLAASGASIVAQRIQIVDDAKLPRFEVASVKLGNPNATSARVGIPPGRFVQEDMDMFSALNMAFSVTPRSGGGEIVETARG
jgi:hypothetical protein